MNNDKTTEKKDLFELSGEILSKLEINTKDCVSTTFVFRTDDKNHKIKGLNIQMYGHVLIIVPDIKTPDTYYKYLTHVDKVNDSDTKRTIFEDLLSKGYTQIDVAKLMKCSHGTVTRIMEGK
jgi:hypothetical protein